MCLLLESIYCLFISISCQASIYFCFTNVAIFFFDVLWLLLERHLHFTPLIAKQTTVEQFNIYNKQNYSNAKYF